MKKAILTIFLCLATIGITQAKRVHIPMQIRTALYEQKKKGGIRHVPACRTNIPIIVEVDDNNILIRSIQAGTNVSLILNDAQGNIIYESDANSSSSCLMIEIPPEIIEKTSSIIITLNGIDYIGEIY